jgi:uncharacterized protein YozE (UPF0346 family)
MAERVFSLMHLSLVGRQKTLFGQFDGTREEWLRSALSQTFDFLGWGGRELVWVPKRAEDGLLFGLIQGKSPVAHHEEPTAGGAETVSDLWQGAYLFLDPSHHEEGQKLALENDVLGAPQSLAKYLFEHLNLRDDAPYTTIAELIFDENDFWKFSSQNNDILRYIRFRFVVPNMWGPQNDLDKDLKETGTETGAERVDVTFSSGAGVTTKNEKVESAVSYTQRGAGEIRARSMEGKNYSSKTEATTKSVPKADLDDASDEAVSAIAARVLQ